MPRPNAREYPSWEEIAHASQMNHMAAISSADELGRSLASPASRYRFVERLRWPQGFRCRYCGHHAPSDRGVLRPHPGLLTCRACQRFTRVLAGTMLDDRRAPLGRWLSLLWLLADDPAAVNVAAVGELLELESIKLAEQRWRTLAGLLSLSEREPLVGPVEVDGRVLDLGTTHAIVLVGVETRTAGRARLRHTGHLGADVVHSFVEEVVQPGGVVRTDCWSGYLALRLYRHELSAQLPETSEHLERVDVVMRRLRRWLRSQNAIGFEQLSYYLSAFVAELNESARGGAASTGQRFCDLLALALRAGSKLRPKRMRARISGVRRVDREDDDSAPAHDTDVVSA